MAENENNRNGRPRNSVLPEHGPVDENGKEILLSVKRDSPYYSRSGGGITLSGGEPLLQHKAACFLLEECKRAGIHTAIETAGNVPFSAIREVMPVTDLFLFDIKGMDPVRHKRNTGVTNELILDNAVKTAALHSGVRFRMPYVPGFNDDEAASVAGFAKKLNVPLELMAYHNIGLGKYRSLNRTCETEKIIPARKGRSKGPEGTVPVGSASYCTIGYRPCWISPLLRHWVQALLAPPGANRYSPQWRSPQWRWLKKDGYSA